jgi:MCM P-loop domain/Toprim-like
VAVRPLKPDTIRRGFNNWFVGEENEEGEQRAYCPVCEDPDASSSPSAMFNAEEDVWNCLKGNHGGSITTLSKQLKQERGWDIRSASMTGNTRREGPKATEGKQKPKGPPPSPEDVTRYHEALLDHETALNHFMTKRGIDEESIVEYEIGWDARTKRYTIPVYDKDGELVNIRKYKMGASGSEQKFFNHPGYGDARIFMPWVIDDADAIIMAEGELDCILLNQMGFPAVSGTGGSGTFKQQWTELFTDKAVYVAYDQDESGEKGALRVANVLRNFALAVYRVKLPTPGSDVTDFVVEEGYGIEDFEKLLEKAQSAGNRSSRDSTDMPTAGQRVTLLESMSDKHGTEPLELVVSVTGKQAEPFTAPKRIVATCDMSKGVACETCPLMARNGQMTAETQAHDARLVNFVDVTSTTQQQLLRKLLGARCGDRVQFDVEELWRVEALAVQNAIDERSDDEVETPIRRQAWSIGTYRSQTNEKIRLVGRNVQDPKSGVLRFQSWINQKVELDIDSFKLTPEIRDRLKVFQPSEGQSAFDKALEIARDMSANVTRIVGRDLLHVGLDLVWHSVIAFRVHDQDVTKGWLEMMVVGDTRTGKSEAAERLMKHYNSGRMVSCEGVTFAGLIGGVQQINQSWHMTWGVVPMNDRRLVVLDEVSGMAEKNIIEQMSSVRSAGIAQITKIAQESTSARTRLIWISNPVGGKFLSENRLGGVGALLTVVPNMEDIARFDFVMAAAKGDVSSIDINSDTRPGTPTYSADDCELLVKWAWSLTRDNVRIGNLAIAAAARHAIEMGERYTSNPPLIQSENVRFKILRIATALAARTFSVGKNGHLLVNKSHVDDAVKFLDAIYSQDSLGYGRISREENARQQSSKTNIGLALALMREHPEVFRTLFMNSGGEFRVRDFEEFQGMSSGSASMIASKLHEWGLTRYAGRGVFTMTQQLIELLEELNEEGI